MKFLVGDDNGLCKIVKVEAQKVERFGPARKGDALERMCWAGSPQNREERFAAAFASGAVELRNGEDGRVLATVVVAPSVRCLAAHGADLLMVSADGSLQVVQGWCGETPMLVDVDLASAPEGEVVAEGKPTLRKTSLPGPVADAHIDPLRSDSLAFGGGENDLKVFDLRKGEVVWKAKALPENSLCLKMPIKLATVRWVTEMAPKRTLLACGTSDGKIRVYDTSMQRRPLFELVVAYGAAAGTGTYTGAAEEVPRPVVCSAVGPVRDGEWGLFVGNTLGVLREFNLEKLPDCPSAEVKAGRKSHLKWASKQLPFRQAFKGIMGSVRAVEVHKSGDVVVAVGLGRFAHVFDLRKRRQKLLSKVYLKQKLCSVLVSAEERVRPAGGSDDEDAASDAASDATGGVEEPVDEVKAEEPHRPTDEIQEGFTSDEEEEKAMAGKKKKRAPKRKASVAHGDTSSVDARKPKKPKRCKKTGA